MRFKQIILSVFILTTILLPSPSLYAKTTVKVGGYEFPPFLESNHKTKKFTGLTIDLIRAMNDYQNKYNFEFLSTSPKRRYHDFELKKFDFIFFESKAWGWKDYSVGVSNVFLEGGERYLALKAPGRDQSYFSDFKNKRMIGILGYHYGFSGFNSDQVFLKEKFNMRLTRNHVGSIEMILKKRGDIAVVTQSYLDRYLLKHPEKKKDILISEKLDQEYKHVILVRDGTNPDIAYFNALLDKMKADGILNKLWKKYGIAN